MSLINRMLRELSSRETRPADVLSGIQVPHPLAPPRRPGRRLAVFVVLIAGFTAVFWALLSRKGSTPPPTAAPARVASAAPAPAAAPRFQLDDSLSDPAAMRAAPRPVPRRPAALRADPSLEAMPPARTRRAAPAPEPAVPAAPARAVPAEAPARDVRAAQARFAEAQRALKGGERRTAEQELRHALELDAAHHAAREALATLLIDDSRFVEAQSVLDDGLALAPDRLAFRRLGARIDLARGQPALALQRLEANAPTVAADPEYHGLLASAYQRLGRHEPAAALYQSLTENQPGEPHWWAGYGLSRDALGDASGALAAYAHARSLGRLDPRVLEHINRRSAALSAGS